MMRNSMAAALLAMMSLGVGAGAQANPSANTPRVYARVEQKSRSSRQATKRRNRKAHKRAALKSEPWQRFKDGTAIDGRGDYRSPKRQFRRAVEAKMGGPLSGRQWEKVRRFLRHGGTISV